MVEDDIHVVQGMPILSPLPDLSVGQIIYNQLLANCSNNEAVIDAASGQSFSYKTILSKTCSLAESLRKSGYNQNTMIGICSENNIEFFIPIIAGLYIGATVVPINHGYFDTELAHVLNISKPQITLRSEKMFSKLSKLETSFKIQKMFIIDNKSRPESVETFVAQSVNISEPLYRFDVAKVDINDHVAFILNSSGTTGLPKGVMITDRNVLVQFSHGDDPRLYSQARGRSTLGYLPFFHAFGLFVGLRAIKSATRLVVIKNFDLELFLSCIEKYKISGLPLVPSLAVLLAKSPLVEKYDFSSVSQVGCGTAPLSKEIEEILKKRLKVDSIVQGYGLTEATLTVTGFPGGTQKHGSAGMVFPHLVCKIRDPASGKSLGPNKVGEICVKGDSVMKGYYGNKEATRNAFSSNGWLLTGDLGYYDNDKFFYIVGRLKELIKYKGFQVAPAELEAILLTNPKIKDAAVIGVPNEEAGELPLAFVVANSKVTLTENEVERYIAERVSSHKRLRGGVYFIAEIPKNASGKILRQKLRLLFNNFYASKL